MRRLALLAVLLALAGAVLWRRRSRARRLAARPGERILVVGAGDHVLPLAAGVAPGGTVEVLDSRREALDRTLTRAAAAGLEGIVATEAEPAALPFDDASMDAVLVTVRGDAALGEARRVVRPGGRVVTRH